MPTRCCAGYESPRPDAIGILCGTTADRGGPSNYLITAERPKGDKRRSAFANRRFGALEVFSINEKVLGLADAARTAFSAEVGVGFSDLYMTSLGYAYRANARKLIPRGIVGDFLYDGTPTLNVGVVLVEGKGSIGGRSTMRHVRRMTRGGYKKQVDRHVGTHPKGVSILHGYAIGAGARPGRADS